MPFASGTFLGPYEILSQIGAGGMGEVFKARDVRLGRVVAIKVLSADLITDSRARERFRREARAISSLNHAHICTLYDFGHENNIDFLVMEYVEGERLKGPMAIDRAVELGVQIADALDHAHRREVIHRDLKPANIRVTKSGAKLMDFGLARLPAQEADEIEDTKTMELTRRGMIVGTPPYIAPEQWEGKKVDGRADIFSFGAVLYEMITGQRAFGGTTEASVATAVVRWEPAPVSSLQPTAPPVVDHIVKKCLMKAPENRWQNASDLRDELQWALETLAQDLPSDRTHLVQRFRRLSWILAGALLLLIGASGIQWFFRQDAEPPLRRFSLLKNDSVHDAAISPDGRRIAFTSGSGSQQALWIQDLDKDEPRKLDGTEGAWSPFWSPDSKQIGFTSGAELKRVPAAGGTAIALSHLPATWVNGLSWQPDGDSIVFSSGSPFRLYQASASGGAAQLLLEAGGSGNSAALVYPYFLPVKGKLLFAKTIGNEKWVVLLDLATRSEKTLVSGTRPVYSDTGHILYERGTETVDLWALPFSLKRLEATGDPFLVRTGASAASVSSDGTLVCLAGGGGGREQLVWRDRSGRDQGAVGQPETEIFAPALSPDGRRVAVEGREGERFDLWIQETGRPVKTRLTFDTGRPYRPVWSPSGDRIAFSCQHNHNWDIFTTTADGTGQHELLCARPDSDAFPNDWSADGKYIVYVAVDSQGQHDIWYLRLKEDGRTFEPHAFATTPFSEQSGYLSPDGRYMAYVSDESGRFEVYIQRFPEGGGKQRISLNGGDQPAWSRDGRELFYVEGETLLSAEVRTTPGFSIGLTKRLFQTGHATRAEGRHFDVSADGQRFVFVRTLEQPRAPEIRVTQNWLAEFGIRRDH